MNSIDRQYKELLEQIIHFGVEKKDRTGTGTKSIFGWQIRHNMQEGFPLLTTKKMAWKSIVTELLWFLRGGTNIKYLVDNGCNIWNGDAYRRYERTWNWDLDEPLPMEQFIERIKTDEDFARVWGELGPIYGKQWRNWGGWVETKLTQERDENGYLLYEFIPHKGADQISNLINELKNNPDSRRLMVNAWNVGELDSMILPPCHYGFQVYTREMSTKERNDWFQIHRNGNNPLMKSDWKDYELDQQNIPKRVISLMWNQRSVDTFLGLPFNIASYGLLLKIIAKEVNMIPEELIGNLGDCHLYSNHIEQAKEQITRIPYELPDVVVRKACSLLEDREYTLDDIQLLNYEYHPAIKAPLSN